MAGLPLLRGIQPESVHLHLLYPTMAAQARSHGEIVLSLTAGKGPPAPFVHCPGNRRPENLVPFLKSRTLRARSGSPGRLGPGRFPPCYRYRPLRRLVD